MRRVLAESDRGDRRARRRSPCSAAIVYLRRSLPQVDGTVDGRRPVGAGRHHPRRRRHPAHLRGDQGATRCSASATCTRRIGCGRWSSSGGSATAGCPRSSAPPTLPQDRFLRTVGFGRAAQTRLGRDCRRWAKQQIDAYVAGVNAFIADASRQPLPPEFTLLRFEPEPWTGADVIVWVKMMAWDLSANYTFELLRHDLVARRRRGAHGAADAAVPGGRPEHPVDRAVGQRGQRRTDADGRSTDAPAARRLDRAATGASVVRRVRFERCRTAIRAVRELPARRRAHRRRSARTTGSSTAR